MAECPASAVLLLCILNVLFPSSDFYFLPNDKFSLCSSGPNSDHFAPGSHLCFSLPNGLTSCLCVPFPLVLPSGTECWFLDDGVGAQEPMLLGTAGLCWVLSDCGWRGCFHNGFAVYQQLSYWAFDAFLAVNNLMGFFSFCKIRSALWCCTAHLSNRRLKYLLLYSLQ